MTIAAVVEAVGVIMAMTLIVVLVTHHRRTRLKMILFGLKAISFVKISSTEEDSPLTVSLSKNNLSMLNKRYGSVSVDEIEEYRSIRDQEAAENSLHTPCHHTPSSNSPPLYLELSHFKLSEFSSKGESTVSKSEPPSSATMSDDGLLDSNTLAVVLGLRRPSKNYLDREVKDSSTFTSPSEIEASKRILTTV